MQIGIMTVTVIEDARGQPIGAAPRDSTRPALTTARNTRAGATSARAANSGIV
ncbi:hypothetical protein [Burkholderia pseudomultivorans]|uniref:hypothetical protein n=1 Tax=Burkholderia pseudomultivorans TaxID=1207504 RepID=UPI0012D9E90F|nr:hypothetical protein [Burkholderia pseudomultivorans]